MGIHHLLSYNIRIKHVSEVNLYETETNPLPYCGSIAILRDASYVYGNKAKDGKLYVCSHFPQCNSYVGVHPGTTNAKGKLANKELRQKRIQAHRVFDQIWLNHIFTKSEAYRWIADKFCLTAKEAHIGEFSTYMCDQLILEYYYILYLLLKSAPVLLH